MKLGYITSIALIFFIVNINGFGYVGHEITASIAQKFLRPKVLKVVKNLLPKECGGNLSCIAAWADKVKYTQGYRFTSRMHYINTKKDHPPEYCPTDVIIPSNRYHLVSAIHNYTNRLDRNNNGNKSEALNFLVHFIGDLHQPLHLCSKLGGGNHAPAMFEGHRTNLHSVWDTRIIYKRIRELHNESHSLFVKTWEEPDDPFDKKYRNANLGLFGGVFYDLYVNHIVKLIKTVWKNESKDWVTCKEDFEPNHAGSYVNFGFDNNNNNDDNMNFNQIHFNNNDNPRSGLSYLIQHSNNKKGDIACPEYWMVALGSLNCNFIWKDFDSEMDLSEGEYYKKINDSNITEKLLAIAGIRIAAILNTLLM